MTSVYLVLYHVVEINLVNSAKICFKIPKGYHIEDRNTIRRPKENNNDHQRLYAGNIEQHRPQHKP